jgi:hypothetical protein
MPFLVDDARALSDSFRPAGPFLWSCLLRKTVLLLLLLLHLILLLW